jgi:DNA-binding GntR family transcriptional regulator
MSAAQTRGLHRMTSQLERIRDALRHDIGRGALAPGAAIDEREIARRFGVSRTPVREALLMLAAQELVVIAPRAGIRVAEPPPELRVAMLEALAELEGVVARLCALRMGAAERAVLAAACADTRVAAAAVDTPAYVAANERFHAALHAGSGNVVVAGEIARLRLRLAGFRRAVHARPGRLAAAASEHEAVLAALGRGDADGAAQAMRDHVLAKGRAYADLLLGRGAGPTGSAPDTASALSIDDFLS